MSRAALRGQASPSRVPTRTIIVDAIDADAESIEDARRVVAAAGLADRVRPAVHDASDPELGGRYDLATIFEALHDMKADKTAGSRSSQRPCGGQQAACPTAERLVGQRRRRLRLRSVVASACRGEGGTGGRA
jgi:hypothetical protein